MPLQSKLEPNKNTIITEYLAGKSTVKLGIAYDISSVSVGNFLRKNGIALRNHSDCHRQYAIRQDFFDKIDTQEKAYFLGILYADGCNYSMGVKIQLTGDDKEILVKLGGLIYKQHRPLHVRKARRLIIKGKETFGNEAYVLDINNKRMAQVLSAHGLVPAKSLITIFPSCVSTELMPHFIRGYFDGDGSIGITKDNQMAISILGTNSFCISMQANLAEVGIKASICHAKKGRPTKQLAIHGNTAGRRLMDWLYQNSTLHMNRKYVRYQEILKVIPAAKPASCSACDKAHYSSGYCKQHHYEFIGKNLRHERWLREKALCHN